MNPQSIAVDAYKRAALENAPPIKIVRMLYQGAMRFLDEATKIDPLAERGRFQDRVHRAEAIVVELRISLEREHAPELCTELERLYVFTEDKMREAVDHGDVEALRAARSVLDTLYSAWKQLEVQGSIEEAA